MSVCPQGHHSVHNWISEIFHSVQNVKLTIQTQQNCEGLTQEKDIQALECHDDDNIAHFRKLS